MVDKNLDKSVVAEPLMTAVLTDLGKKLLDEAYQAGKKLIITEMSLGDSNLVYVKPDPAFTKLVHEFGRQPINEGNTQETWINAIVYVDATRWKGNTIFEFGLHDASGNLIVYSSYPSTFIPDNGSEYVQIEIECSLDLYNASAVTISITPIYPHATELEAGIARVATDEQVIEGVSDEVFITPKKLKDNPMPLILKHARLYPDDLNMSVLPIQQSPYPEWILPASASKVKFINIQTKIKTSEPINISLTIFCHDSVSGGTAHPSANTVLFFSVPNFSTAFGVYNNFVVPIVLGDGGTPKRLSFSTGSYGPNASVVSQFDIVIDAVWESPS